MRKKAFLRGLLGLPLGIAIGYLVTIFISLALGNGNYVPCIPEFVTTMGNEINAVILQTVLCGLLGSSFAACSLIWEIDHWSIAKQTCIYFLITSLVMMPIAYFTNWMQHTIVGFLIYFGIFVFIFIAVWFSQYIIWKSKVRKINTKFDGKQQS